MTHILAAHLNSLCISGIHVIIINNTNHKLNIQPMTMCQKHGVMFVHKEYMD